MVYRILVDSGNLISSLRITKILLTVMRANCETHSPYANKISNSQISSMRYDDSPFRCVIKRTAPCMLIIHKFKGIDGTRFSSSRQVYQVSSKETSSSKQYNFWGRKESRKCEDDADLPSSPIEFQTEKGDYSAYSPPLWANKSNVNSNLLPHDHHYSSPPPTSRLQAIEDGRKELMEMVRGMPESSYELSLQDIVDDGIGMKEVKQDAKKKSERNSNRSTLKRHSRSQSMNDEVFLLKMFFPSCLSSKKKTTFENHSKVSRVPSFDGYEKPVDKERWSISCLLSRKNRSNSSGSGSSSSRSSSGSTSRNSSSRGRSVDGNYTQGCFTSDNLGKSRGQRGCLF